MREWLKKIRKEKRYPPKEIAEECGITRNYFDLIEAGKRNPSVALAKRLGEFLGFDWTWFFNPPAEVILDAKSVDAGIIQHK